MIGAGVIVCDEPGRQGDHQSRPGAVGGTRELIDIHPPQHSREPPDELGQRARLSELRPA
jgi:hypothetical protein